MQPLINKYQINPERNELFKKLISMFDGQPNYQLWAVKSVFSTAVSPTNMNVIKKFANENQPLIASLSKQNLVAYKSSTDFKYLMKEIKGANMIQLIKSCCDKFNTDQKHLLYEHIRFSGIPFYDAASDANLNEWFKRFKSLEKLPSGRKNNVYTNASSFRDIGQLVELIEDAIKEDYEWEHDDLITFIDINASDCEIVYDKDNIVITKVPSYASSKALCGKGRTQWCLSKEERFFRDYVTSKNDNGEVTQYFLFDFNKAETNPLAHIGFTVRDRVGIINAYSCDDLNMLGNEIKVGNKMYDIFKALSEIKIPMKIFMGLKDKAPFVWSFNEAIDFIKGLGRSFTMIKSNGDVLVVKANDRMGFEKITKPTFINGNNGGSYVPSDDKSIYLIFDFSKEFGDDLSMSCLKYKKDDYGTLSVDSAVNIFGNKIDYKQLLSNFGLKEQDVIGKFELEPTVLLHKYIDQNCEEDAIKLILSEGKNFDVNYQFQDRKPVFSALYRRQYKLFKTIISHPKFDGRQSDGIGETLLESLFYVYSSYSSSETNEAETLKEIILNVIESDTYDLNQKDVNDDTVLSLACEFGTMDWAVERLVSDRRVDINIVNDIGCTPLTNAIVNKSEFAIKMLGKRPDLIIRNEDRKLAKASSINLDSYIQPTQSIFKNHSVSSTSDEEVLCAAIAR